MRGAAAVGARDVNALLMTGNTNARAQAAKLASASGSGKAQVDCAQPNTTN